MRVAAVTAHLRAALLGALRGAVVGAAAAEHLAAHAERDAAEAAHANAVGYRERHAAMARLTAARGRAWRADEALARALAWGW